MAEKLHEQSFGWHADLPDVPGKSAAEMKAFFDAPHHLFLERINELIDEIEKIVQQAEQFQDLKWRVDDIEEAIPGEPIQEMYPTVYAVVKYIDKTHRTIRGLINDNKTLTDGEIDKLKNDLVMAQKQSEVLLDAYSVELRKTMPLTGDELEGKKTSNYIHINKITDGNRVEFGNVYNYSGTRYFGYVGVKRSAVEPGARYMLLVEVDIETEHAIGNFRVFGFNRPQGNSTGANDKNLGRIGGNLKQGKNYILYPFTASDGEIDGIFMDSFIEGENNTKAQITLCDVRLYKDALVEANFNPKGLKDWKYEILTHDNLIMSEINEYALRYDGTNFVANSLSNALDAEAILYKPLEEKIRKIADEKTVKYYRCSTGDRLKLRKGAVYLVLGGSKSVRVYDESSSLVKDVTGTNLPAFTNGLFLITSNDLDGTKHYRNYCVSVESTLGIPSYSPKEFYLYRTKEDTGAMPYIVSESSDMQVYEIYLG